MIVADTGADMSRDRVPRIGIDLVRRRTMEIGLATLAALIVAAVLVALTPRSYTAEAVVAIDARKIQVLPLESVVSRLPQEAPALRTELDLIQSRSMAERVLDRLPPDMVADLGRPARPSLPRRILAKMFGGGGGVVEAPAETRRRAVDALLSGLRVSNDGRSYTIFVAYSAQSPERAATIANAFAETYILQQTTVHSDATREAADWLAQRLAALRARLEQSEAEVQAMRRSSGLIEVEGRPLQEQKLIALNAEIAAARANRVGAEARLATAAELARNPQGVGTFAEVLGSPAIQTLRREYDQVRRRMQEFEDIGATKNSLLPSLTSQAASLDRQIQEEIRRILQSLGNEVQIAQRKERDLAAARGELETELVTAQEALVRVRQFEREVAANKAIYEGFLGRYKQTVESHGLSNAEARLISRAEPPGAPSRSWTAILAIALMGGAGAGLGIAYLREWADDRIHSIARLQAESGLPVLAMLPAARRWWVGAVSDEDRLAAARRFDELLTHHESMADRAVRGIALTSVDAGPAKAEVASLLARAAGREGRMVTLVDADGAGSSAAAALGVEAPPDPEPHADDEVRAEPAVWIDRSSGVRVVGGLDGWRTGHGTPEGLGPLLQALERGSDLVVVNAPPLSDSLAAAHVARHVAGLALVVEWDRTTHAALAAALHDLALCGIRPIGLVVHGVDRRRPPVFEPVWPGLEPHAVSHPRPVGDRTGAEAATVGAVQRPRVAKSI